MLRTRVRLRSISFRLFCYFSGWVLGMVWVWPFPQAQAQEIQPDAANGGRETATTLDTIQVTAQFRSQNLQETPLAISAMTTEMMEARSQFSVLDIAGAAPNVNIAPMAGPFGNGAAVSIRGVGQNESSFAVEPGVGLYIDDVYHPTLLGSAFDLLDLERVEILRGPQGTLAGKNSIGGAIKLYSHLPDDAEGGMLETTIGAFNRRDLRAMGNFVLEEDSLFLRMSGVSKKRDGYLTRYDYGCRFLDSGFSPASARGDCVLGHEGGERYQGIRAALRWAVNERFEINVIADASDVNDEPLANQILASPDARFISDERYVNYSTYTGRGWNGNPVNTVKSRGISGKFDWHLGLHHKLTSITAYREYDADWGTDVDGSPVPHYIQQWIAWNHTFSQELRLNGSMPDERFEYTIGSYYSENGAGLEGIVDIPGLLAYQEDPVVSRNKSLFAHVMYRLSDTWDLSAGVRYTDESKKYTFTRLDPMSMLPLNDIHGQVGYYQGHQVDWRIAGSWKMTDATMLYASWSTGFKGGGINARPFIPAQVQPFEPETLKAWEAGLKMDVFDRRLRVNTSVFLNNYDDIVIVMTNGYAGFPLSAIPINAGEAQMRGAELEVTAYPIDGLMVDAAYSWLDFKYTKLSQQAQDSLMEFWMTRSYTSKNKASLGIQYDLMLARSRFASRLDVTYHSDFFTQSHNSEISRIPAQALANVRFTWYPNNANWELATGATNLFDSYYYTNSFDIISSSGLATANPARPREWFVSVKYIF